MKRVRHAKVLLVASSVLLAWMVFSTVFDDSQEPEGNGWSLVGTAQAGGDGRGRGKSSGSHTDHDHDVDSHTSSEHTSGDSDHDHAVGQDSNGKSGKAGAKGHRGRAVGGGSRRVEELIFRSY